MDPTKSSNNIECEIYRLDEEPILTPAKTLTYDIETPSPEMKNVEMAVPVVCPDEEPILTPAPSAKLMTTEAISFEETDTNAQVKTSTYDIEFPGPEIKNVEMAVPVVCPDEEPILTPAPSAKLMTMEAISFVETDTNAPVEISIYDIEFPGPEIKNVEMAVPVVCPDEEPILTPAPSAKLMTTEAISFVETDTNAPVNTSTYEIETPGPEMKNVEVKPPVVCPVEEQTLSPGEESEKETTNIDTDKTVPLRKKKSRFLSALRRGLRRVFRTICGCSCVTSSNKKTPRPLDRSS